jgi:hypothetical protein
LFAVAAKDCDHVGMLVVVSASTAEAIDRQGGRLYVWLRRNPCCGGTTTLEASTSPPLGKEFRREETSASFELFLPKHLASLPEELHVETKGRSHRVRAYWNGCAWVA